MTQLILPGDAGFADVLSGKKFSAGTNYNVSGSMPNNGAVTLTPSGTGPVTIPVGYHNGSGQVSQVSVPAANVLTGTTIAGIAGTMTNNGQKIITPSSAQQSIQQGYHDGTGYVKGDTNLIASNILSGISIFGVMGNVTPKFYASGSTQTGNGYTVTMPPKNTSENIYPVTVSGLNFTPEVIVILPPSNYNYATIYISAVSTTSYLITSSYFSGGYGISTMSLDPAGDYVNSSGFRLASGDNPQVNVNWYAWG